jgi:probable HAF family extracellular repeat protein
MRDLGALAGGESEATAINNDGVIVGWSRVTSGDMRAVRWMNGVKRNLGTLGGRNSMATDINVFGHIVGWSDTRSGARHAFVWKNGVMTDIGTLGGSYSEANAINNGGVVVGWSRTASGEGHAFRWKEGVFKNLGPANRRSSTATGINTAGQIVGWLGTWHDAVGEEEDVAEPFLYQRETMTSLPQLLFTTQANAIGPTGLVVGSTEELRDPWGTRDALLWENRVLQVLPELTNGNSSAYSVNRAGNIVGYSETKAGDFHAVLWRRQ